MAVAPPDRAAALLSAVLRRDVEIADPLGVVRGFAEAGWQLDLGDVSAPLSFAEVDLRRANRYGARISAAEIAAILERRRAIEAALRAIPPAASLTRSAPWQPLRQLFDAFADIRGVGFSKMTKALHPKRPALIPMLDSVVQRYLEEDDPGANAPFGERALALVRGYERDLARNRTALRAIRREVGVSDVRILDLLIWSVM